MGVIWGKREGEYFWGRGLDRGNQIDLVEEISRDARAGSE